jgi:hypothetical protein
MVPGQPRQKSVQDFISMEKSWVRWLKIGHLGGKLKIGG